MEWPLETRRKLARLVMERALGIQEEEFKAARQSGATFTRAVDLAYSRILDLLEPLGFERAGGDWRIESSMTTPVMFEQSDTNLWFDTIQGRVVRISKENAEKVLVLGIP
jgi:hypothetical protein